ncbi:MAG: cupredoxin domain-containing protein [Chloroflexi bacterium]|nr:cupredoxin domain-containing protein [Chloroflexota bacterium]
MVKFRFVPATLEATAGQTTRFEVTGDSFSHTFTIRSLGVDVVFSARQKKTVEFDVPAGTSGNIELVCRFHEGAGMVGTLQITGGDSSNVTTPRGYY